MPSFRILPAILVLLAATATARASAAANEIAIDAARIQQSLQTQFPYSVEVLGGLLVLTARDPALTIPARGDRLRMRFRADAGSPGAADLPLGRVLLSGALRYDKPSHAFYLDAPVIEQVVPDRPGIEVDANGRELLTLLLQAYAGSEPLYRLDPKLLATFGDLQVESVRIEDGRVVIAFNQPIGMPELPDETE
ncbi:MAG: DUF1439 domain-containing protein [Pseudoxanthomonas sp.]